MCSSGLSLKLGFEKLNPEDKTQKLKQIKEKLDTLFVFLKENRTQNKGIQLAYYRSVLLPWPCQACKIKSLLQNTWNTQSSPRMDPALPTWQSYQQQWNCFDNVKTAEELANAIYHLVPESKEKSLPEDHKCRPPLDRVWRYLRLAPGFGDKTAALFVKAIIDIHIEKYNDIQFLDNFALADKDNVRIPVDTVIQFIFQRIMRIKLEFQDINEIIFKLAEYKPCDASIWDDLWFWGFITQKVAGNARVLEMNEAKFWAIKGATWDSSNVRDVKCNAKKFIKLIGNLSAG